MENTQKSRAQGHILMLLALAFASFFYITATGQSANWTWRDACGRDTVSRKG